MIDARASQETCRKEDWAGHWRSLALLWGVPAAAMLGSALLESAARGAIWTIALIWMGTACLANARRCTRTHCKFTGPFYLLMAVPVVALTFGALPLGAYGWSILGGAILLGTAILWWGTELVWGRFSG
jgi:hypothetical protein